MTDIASRLPVPRLHVITDVVRQQTFTHVQLATMAIEGGADLVQLRDKLASDDELESAAAALVDLCRDGHTLPLINDRVQLASRVGARGVHVGKSDMSTTSARALLGSDVLLGATANNLAEAIRAATGPIDYLGVGPVFGTQSKASPAPTLGIRGLAEICAAVSVPVIAIGNVQPHRVPDLLSAGAHGVAVLGAVCLAPDPRVATAAFRAAIDSWVADA